MNQIHKWDNSTNTRQNKRKNKGGRKEEERVGLGRDEKGASIRIYNELIVKKK